MQVISGRSVRFWLVGIVFLLLDVFSSGQTITLSPKSGPPTTKLNISGSGFSLNSAVDIYFDTTDEVLIITDGTGAFAKTTLKTPASAVPGQHWVSAVQRSTGSGSQAAFTVQTNWAQQGFGPSHQGWNPYENVLNTSNVGSLDLLWTSYFGLGIRSSLSVVGNSIYFTGNNFDIFAAKTSNGSSAWTFGTGNVTVATPAVGNGLCYLGSGDNNIYAMYLSDGFIPWVYITGGQIISSPAYANGVVYISSEDGNLYALNATNGAMIWKYYTGDNQGTS